MRIAAYTTAIISLAFASCMSATSPEYDNIPDRVPEEGNVSIAYIKTQCKGQSSIVAKDIYITGSVVANDMHGEFYKTIVIVDDSGGIEIDIDADPLFIDFPIYRHITVSCNGLALGRIGGKTVLGAAPTGEYTVDRIASADVSRYISTSPDSPVLAEPRTVRIADLSLEHVSDYIRIDNVRFTRGDGTTCWCDTVGDSYATTDRTITDIEGNELTVRTSGQCNYASEPLPVGYGTVTGILDLTADGYVLRISNHGIVF